MRHPKCFDYSYIYFQKVTKLKKVVKVRKGKNKAKE